MYNQAISKLPKLGYLCFLLSTSSCIDASNSNSEVYSSSNVDYELYSKAIDTMVIDVLKEFPNFGTNSIVKDDAQVAMIAKFHRDLTPNLIEDVNYEVYQLIRNPKDDGYIVHLKNSHYASYKNADGSFQGLDIRYDVLGKVSDSLAKSINENAVITIKCKNVQRLLTEKEISNYVDRTYYYQLLRIGTQERAEIELGCFLCDIISTTPILRDTN